MFGARPHVKKAMAVSGTALLVTLLASSAAQAGQSSVLGNCTDIIVGELCGKIKNHSSSDTDLWVIDNWPPERANGAFARPGESSTRYFKDTDGFYVPTGCRGIRSLAPDVSGGAWYKIPDTHNSTIELRC